MSGMDPAKNTRAALAAARAAFAAARAAPAVVGSLSADEDDDQADIATPRAKAAAVLEAALKARRDWYRTEGSRNGESLCKTLIDMCAWHEHPELRDQILALQDRGLAFLEAVPDGQPSAADVGDLQDRYQHVKPREDDAAAIAAALGMSLEEARAFGLVGTLDTINVDGDDSGRLTAGGTAAESLPEEEEDLETLFRREAFTLVAKLLPQALQRFWSAQQSMDALLAVRRGFHTLKGDARVTAQTTSPDVSAELETLAVLSEAAEDIVDYLLGDDYDTAQPAPALPPGAFSLLNETVSALAHRLEARAPLTYEADLLHRLKLMHRKAAALSGISFPEPLVARPMPAPQAAPARSDSPQAAPARSDSPQADPQGRPRTRCCRSSLMRQAA